MRQPVNLSEQVWPPRDQMADQFVFKHRTFFVNGILMLKLNTFKINLNFTRLCCLFSSSVFPVVHAMNPLILGTWRISEAFSSILLSYSERTLVIENEYKTREAVWWNNGVFDRRLVSWESYLYLVVKGFEEKLPIVSLFSCLWAWAVRRWPWMPIQDGLSLN